ncbi:MAG: hypothetical protein ACK4GN_17495 [Runella sp.]
MKTYSVVIIGLFGLLLQGCMRPATKLSKGASIEKEGFIDCFASGLQSGGRELWCEASAVLFDGQSLLMANDKDMPPPDAAVFFWAYSNPDVLTQKPAYLSQNLLRTSQKFEDFALTPDRQWAFLTTAFDRIKTNASDWDGYNSLVYWRVTASPQIQPKSLKFSQNEPFSLGLRLALSQALRSEEFPSGMPYFKVEGLAADDSQLYVGIREEGKQFDNFKYKCKILSVGYRFIGDSIVVEKDIKPVADIDLQRLAPQLPQHLGLSSIEYDPVRKVFWLLTSLESDTQQNCAYLWWATAADLQKGKLNLVNDRSTGQPLRFNHKAEDLTLLPNNRLFIIHDDDRNRTRIGDQTRQPNQAAYSIVQF